MVIDSTILCVTFFPVAFSASKIETENRIRVSGNAIETIDKYRPNANM